MIRCARCGNVLGELSRFCGQCGAPGPGKRPFFRRVGLFAVPILVFLVVAALFTRCQIEITSSDSYALADLEKARTCAELHYLKHGQLPHTLDALMEEGCFQPSRDVILVYRKADPDSFNYKMTASHAKGSKEFMCSSDDDAVYERTKDADEKWTAR